VSVGASVILVDEVVGPRGDRHRHLVMAGSLTNSRPFCDDHHRHLVNRYYDPATYQFLSIDPKVATTMQPYAFVDGDPLNETDPLGLTGDAAAIIRYDRAHHDLCGNRGERRCVGIGHRVAHYADEVRHSAAAAGSWAKIIQATWRRLLRSGHVSAYRSARARQCRPLRWERECINGIPRELLSCQQ